MAFGIGTFLKSIVGIAAPVIGATFGPIGAVVGSAIGSAFSRTPASASIGPSAVGPTAFDVTRRRVGTVSNVAGFAIGAAVSLIADLLRGSRERTGQVVNVAKIIDAVRVCGIAQAAQIFDLTENEICQIVISKRKRRARGISAVDLRRTRSTIRKVHNIAHDLKALSPPVRRHHR